MSIGSAKMFTPWNVPLFHKGFTPPVQCNVYYYIGMECATIPYGVNYQAYFLLNNWFKTETVSLTFPLFNNIIQYRKMKDNKIKITTGQPGKIAVILPYNLRYIKKVKEVRGHRWNLEEKYWVFPHSDNVVKRLLTLRRGFS